jgi:hypothetical protein
MEIGSVIVVRRPGLILSGKVEEISEDSVRVRLSSPRGPPCQFSEWYPKTEFEKPGGALLG